MPFYENRFRTHRPLKINNPELPKKRESWFKARMAFRRVNLTVSLLVIGTQESACSYYYGSSDYALEAVSRNPKNTAKINSEHMADPTFVARLLEIEDLDLSESKYDKNHEWILAQLANPSIGLSILNHVSYELMCDPDFIEKIRKVHPGAVIFACNDLLTADDFDDQDPSVWKNKDHFRALNKNNIHKLRSADMEIKGDEDFMEKRMEVSPDAFKYVAFSVRKHSDKLVRKYLVSQGVKTEEVDDLISAMKALNIYYPERFTIEDLMRVIWNRNNADKLRPGKITLSVYNQKDSNAAFANNEMSKLMKKGHDLLYFEDEEDERVIDRILALNLPDGAVVFAEFGGHGSAKAITYGADDGDDSGKETIDTGDLEKLKKLRPLFSSECMIVLSSCHTGKNGLKAENVANTMATAIPQCEVNAPMFATATVDYQFSLTGKVTGVEFAIGVENAYVLKPYEYEGYLAQQKENQDLLAQAEKEKG